MQATSSADPRAASLADDPWVGHRRVILWCRRLLVVTPVVLLLELVAQRSDAVWPRLLGFVLIVPGAVLLAVLWWVAVTASCPHCGGAYLVPLWLRFSPEWFPFSGRCRSCGVPIFTPVRAGRRRRGRCRGSPTR